MDNSSQSYRKLYRSHYSSLPHW
ncbi:hypothetical protein [Hallerella sp.]